MGSPTETVDELLGAVLADSGLLAKVCRAEAMLLEFAIKAWVLIGCLIGASALFGWVLEAPSEFKSGSLPFSLGCLAIAYFGPAAPIDRLAS